MAAESAPVAIYYDGPDRPLAEGYLDARQIQNLLGHFELAGEIFRVDGYRAGDLSRFRAAFFAGTVSETQLPEAFLADIRASDRPFCWIGRHIGRLVNTPEGRRRFGFSYDDYRDDLEFRQVVYKGVSLPKADPDLNLISIRDPAAVRVMATAVNDENERRAYALRQDRFWYFADTPFSYVQEGDRYLVFCDLLHDILEIDHPAQALALVRIEDVSAEADPADLRRIADRLAARNVPFQISLIPIFRNPSKGFEVYLSDRPFLVDALQYMIERGGTPVMHGATHQQRGQSGDDYEFWDEINNRPVTGDSREAVLRRLEMGLTECLANGISPVAFETPHYAASVTSYRAMAEVFRLFYERTMATPDIASIQFFPYPGTDRLGRFVVPENLGYLEQDNPDPKILIARARNLRVVRDAVASFYFHTFLDPGLLDEVTAGVSGLGYRFVSLRRFGGGVVNPERYAGVQEPPRPAPALGWLAGLRRWWGRVAPTRRALGDTGEVSSSSDAWVLWTEDAAPAEWNNQASYKRVLETFGYRTTAVDVSRFGAPPREKSTVLVLPWAAAATLSDSQRKEVLRHLEAGGRVIADRKQEWMSELGFRWMGRRIPVSAVTDVLFPEMPLGWQPEEMVERFTPPEGIQQLMVDPRSRQVLALGGEHGQGRYIFLASAFDPMTPGGTSRYPYFAEYLSEAFRIRAPLRSPRVEVYFDPSYREGANLDRLAATWRQAGIRIVYAAAWQIYRNHQFNYADLVRACHRNGISVYAWFVFPAVTPKMWDERPEWRERTAAGTDGRVGWRPSMNFEDPECFRAAMDWMKQTLRTHDWDGVNLTELNFDADFDDYLRADRFVPMNDHVRAGFRERAGFDPAELFDPRSERYHKRNSGGLEEYLRYREDIVTNWHRRVLGELEPLRRGRGWEAIVTMLDSLHSEYVRPALGVDSRRIAGLMKEFDFTLQVEDPAEHWASPPERYEKFAATYAALVPDRRRLMFDINVVPDRSVAGTSLPSATATGTELARTVAAAAAAAGRVAIYSEFTVPGQDWGLIGAALAGASRVEAASRGWTFAAAAPLLIDSPGTGAYYLDGGLWPAMSPEGVLIPAGRHRLSSERPWYRLPDRGELRPRLLHLSADLVDARSSATGIVARYSSPGRAVMLLNQAPLAVSVDGRDSDLRTDRAADGWYLLVPPGDHTIEIVTATRAGVAVNEWGWISASAIAAFGTLTTVLMLAIYFRLRVRRRAAR